VMLRCVSGEKRLSGVMDMGVRCRGWGGWVMWKLAASH
jgi:hypothetical protein